MDIVKELYGNNAAVIGLGVYGKKANLLLSYLQMCIEASKFVSFDEDGGSVNYFYVPVGGKNGGVSFYTETLRAELLGPNGKPVVFGDYSRFVSASIEQSFCGVAQREDGEVCAVVCDDLLDVRQPNETLQDICSTAFAALKRIEKKLRSLGSFAIRLKKTTEINLDFDCSAMLAGKGPGKLRLPPGQAEFFSESKLRVRMMKSVQEEREIFTIDEAKTIVEAACAVATGNPVDRSREWLRPETDLIKVEAAKVKKAAYEKTVDELMTSFMVEAEVSIAEAVKNAIAEKQQEMMKKLRENGFDGLS